MARSCPRSRVYVDTFKEYPGDVQVNFCGVSNPSGVREIGIQCENSDDDNIPEFGDHPAVGGTTAKSDSEIRIHPVQRIKVLVRGNECQTLCDSVERTVMISDKLYEEIKPLVHEGNRMVYRGTTEVLTGDIPIREGQEGRHGKVESAKTLLVDCV